MTQEVELVYWKDVKDSSDPEDLEVFLAKFPAGIYADLARRRLRKLGTDPVPDQTVLSGIAVAEAGAAAASRHDPASVRGASAAPAPQQPAQASRDLWTIPLAPGAGAPGARGAPQEPTPTVPQPRAGNVDMSVPTAAPLPSGGEATTVPLRPAPPEHEDAAWPPPDAAASSRRPRAAVLAGVAALAVGGTLALLLILRDGAAPRADAAAEAASAPVATASAASAAAPQVPSSAAVPLAGQVRRPVAATSKPGTRAATRPRPVARPAATAAAPADTGRVATREPVASPAPEMREQPRSPAPPVRAAASNPADACRDKIFIWRELCLEEQCEKPGARNHPLCVQRRADAKLREESRVRD